MTDHQKITLLLLAVSVFLPMGRTFAVFTASMLIEIALQGTLVGAVAHVVATVMGFIVFVEAALFFYRRFREARS